MSIKRQLGLTLLNEVWFQLMEQISDQIWFKLRFNNNDLTNASICAQLREDHEH